MANERVIAFNYMERGTSFVYCVHALIAHFENLKDPQAKFSDTPVYYLASHSIELLLKAALICAGEKPESLQKYDVRHNLTELFARYSSINDLQNFQDDSVALIQALAGQHKAHTFRYGGPAALPSYQWVRDGLNDIHSACKIAYDRGACA